MDAALQGKTSSAAYGKAVHLDFLFNILVIFL